MVLHVLTLKTYAQRIDGAVSMPRHITLNAMKICYPPYISVNKQTINRLVIIKMSLFTKGGM